MPGPAVKLLVVDDEYSTRSLMAQIFKMIGHSVRTAEDGFTALIEIRQDLPDLILSDLNMPGMSGFELLSVVRRRFPEIQVIAMSGAFSGNSVQPGVAADAFYEKASGLAALLQMVETITDQRRRPAEQHREPAPFWIQSEEDEPSGEGQVTLSCPECLRTFPQVLGKAVGNANIHETACVYCSTLIHFAIVQTANPASPQSFQRKSVITPSPLRLPRAN